VRLRAQRNGRVRSAVVPLSRRAGRLPVALALMLLSLAPLGLSIAQPAPRDATLRFVDGALVVDLSLTDFFDDALRERLESGLPAVIEVRVEAAPTGGGPVLARSVRTHEIVFDLWEERFHVEEVVGTERRAFSAPDLSHLVARTLEVRDTVVGSAATYADHRGEAVEVRARALLDPLTPDMVHRIRRWLARPGGSADSGDTFFGSFVGLFVNRSVQGAVAELEVRTAEIRVP
jgi:hypothetical protein